MNIPKMYRALIEAAVADTLHAVEKISMMAAAADHEAKNVREYDFAGLAMDLQEARHLAEMAMEYLEDLVAGEEEKE